MENSLTDAAPLAPPVRAKIPADLETPVSVFLKLQPLGASFLFESVERGIQAGRYSFIGLGPRAAFSLRDGTVVVQRFGPDGVATTAVPVDPADPFAPVRAELARPVRANGDNGPLPPAYAGAVGYIGYDMVRYFEQVPLPVRPGDADLPDYRFLVPGTIAVFDHVRNEIEFLTTPATDNVDGRRAAQAELDRLLGALHTPLPADAHRPLGSGDRAVDPALTANMDQALYEAGVQRAKDHITAGDAFQIVLSQRLSGTTTAAPSASTGPCASSTPAPTCSTWTSATPSWWARRRRCWCACRTAGPRSTPSPARGGAGRPRPRTTRSNTN